MIGTLKPFILSAIILLADQLTKLWVICTIPENHVGYSFFDGFIRLVHVRNDAVAFSLGSSFDLGVKIVLFVILPLIMVVFLGVLVVSKRFEKEFTGAQKWCLAGIIGGGVGNLVDRIFRGLRVVDWISVKFYGFLGMDYFPTWNIADAGVVCSVIILVILILSSSGKTSRRDLAEVE